MDTMMDSFLNIRYYALFSNIHVCFSRSSPAPQREQLLVLLHLHTGWDLWTHWFMQRSSDIVNFRVLPEGGSCAACHHSGKAAKEVRS